jgi:hypothetical protein
MKLKLLACCFLFAACEAPPEPPAKSLRNIDDAVLRMEQTLLRIEWHVQGFETKTCSYPSRDEELQSNL